MALTDLIEHYGYAAVLVGSLLEGETILLLAGLAAHQGHLSLPLVIGIAFVGGTVGDQIFFWLGRRWGAPLLDRIPHARERAAKVDAMLERFQAPVIVGIRFMYGLRIVGPIAIGLSSVAPWRFAFWNMVGAAIWAPLVGGIGYLFGDALTLLLSRLQIAEAAGLGLLAAIAIIVIAVQHWRHRR